MATSARTLVTLMTGTAGTVVLGIARQKYLAHAVGVVGIGELGLLLTFVTLLGTLWAAGLGTSGVRRLAIAEGNGGEETTEVARALLALGLVLGVTGAVLAYVLAPVLGPRFGVDETVLGALGFCAAAVWATVASATRIALLNGLRRVGAFTKANVVGGLLATIGTIAGVQAFGRAALGLAVLLPPLCTWAVAWWLTRDVRALGPGLGAALRRYAGPLVRTGVTFMAGGLVGTAMQYAARRVVGGLLGEEPLGLFQATWSISGLYIGFVLSAFAADYYPRISALEGKPEAQAEVLESQVMLSVWLVVPVILGAILAAPFVVRLLYTPSFAPMVPMLRWQLAGDLLKVTAWALSYLLLARGATVLFASIEALWAVAYLALLPVLLPRFGLEGAAYAYAACYALYLAALLAVVRGRMGVHVRLGLLAMVLALVVVTGSVAALSGAGPVGFAAAVAVAGASVALLVAGAYRRGLLDRFMPAHRRRPLIR